MSLASGKELTKTLLFVLAAVITMSVAVTTRPDLDSEQSLQDDEEGTILFPEFTDTSTVTGLEILSFNEELGSFQPLKIEQARAGEWVIPSREGYPADAQDRVARAATMFVDLKVVKVVQDADHQKLGVVEPKYGETKVGDEGVGTLFRVTGQAAGKPDSTLAELIIGNPVKDLAGQYYVRRPGKSRVYRVEMNPSELSTSFVAWIDRNLLPLPPAQMTGLKIRHYSMVVQDNGQGGKSVSLVGGGYNADLEPTSDGEWELVELQEALRGQMTRTRLKTGEEIDQQRLTELANAFAQLQINDVQRMPESLANKFQVGDTQIETEESSIALASRGFYPARAENEPGAIYAAQGEVTVDLAAGIQFRVLLGELAQQSDSTSLNRFLVILPSVNAAKFPPPDLEELPAENADMSENDRRIAIDRITKANDAKQKTYREELSQVQNVVRALQQRYGAWFYLVPEEVVRKLRISRQEFASLSQEALEQGDGIEAFRMMQSQGLVDD